MYYKVTNTSTNETYYEVYTWEEPLEYLSGYAYAYFNPDESLFLNGVINFQYGNQMHTRHTKYANHKYCEVEVFHGPNQIVSDFDVSKIKLEKKNGIDTCPLICTSIKNSRDYSLVSYRMDLLRKGPALYILKKVFNQEPNMKNIKNATIHPFYHFIAAFNPPLFYQYARIYEWEQYLFAIYPIKPEYNRFHYTRWLDTHERFSCLINDLKNHEPKDLFQMDICDLMKLSEDKYNMFHFIWFNMTDKFRDFYEGRSFGNFCCSMSRSMRKNIPSGRGHNRIMQYTHNYYPDVLMTMDTKKITKIKNMLRKCPKDITDDDFIDKYYKIDYYAVLGNERIVFHPYIEKLKSHYTSMIMAPNKKDFEKYYKVFTDFQYFKQLSRDKLIAGKESDISHYKYKIDCNKKQIDSLQAEINRYEDKIKGIEKELAEIKGQE